MKILFISHAASLTGAPKHVFDLASFLAHRHQVTLVTKSGGRLLEQALRSNSNHMRLINLNINEADRISLAERVETARSLIEKHQPDLVYVNSVVSGEWVIAAKLSHVKNIFHIHEMLEGLHSALQMRTISLDLMDYTDLLICASQDVLESTQKTFSSSPKSSVVMECGFDCEKILTLASVSQSMPHNAKGKYIDPKKVIVCACGTATHRKGIDIFFNTASSFTDIQFLWIGQWINPFETNPMANSFKDEKLDNFFITDETENPYFYMNLADLFVLTSREDSNPLVVYEALILGKQTVCFSKTGGSRVLLDRYGYTITGYADKDNLVSFIKKVVTNGTSIYSPAWTKKITSEVFSKWDIKVVFPKYEQLIEKLFKTGRKYLS